MAFIFALYIAEAASHDRRNFFFLCVPHVKQLYLAAEQICLAASSWHFSAQH